MRIGCCDCRLPARRPASRQDRDSCRRFLPEIGNGLAALILSVAWLAPASAQAPGAANDAKVRQSLEQGFWVIEPGDSLYQISRRFFPDDSTRTSALRSELYAQNPGAFIYGNPNVLVVRARLKLPADLLVPPPAGIASEPPANAASERRRPAPLGQTPAPPAARSDDPPPIIARAPATAAPPASTWVDQLIDPYLTPERLAAEAESDGPEPVGRRSLQIELRSDWREAQSLRILERGIGLQYRQETAQWGLLGVEANLRDTDNKDTFSRARDTGGMITLSQYGLPLGGSWLADNAAGVLRAQPPNFISNGFRVNLPSAILWGAGTQLYDGRTRAYGQAGRVARLIGYSTQQVELESTRAALLGLEHQAAPWLRLGAQANAFRSEDSLPVQSSMALAAEWFPTGDNARVKLVAVGDDERRKGFWLEGDVIQGFFQNRFGAYQFDPGLVIGPVPNITDQRLAYLRTDYRTRRLTYSLEFDAGQSNLDNDPALAGYNVFSLFGSANLRVSREVSVGGSVNLVRENPRTPVSVQKDIDAETAYLRLTSSLGVASFDLGHSGQRQPELPTENAYSLAWNQEWPAFSGINLSTSLARGQETGAQGDLTRTSAGFTLRAFPASGVFLDMNVVGARVQRAVATEKNFNASIGATWQFHPDWQALLYGIWNNIELTQTDLLNPTFRDKSLQLTLRYQKASGTPIIAVGARQPGVVGNGRISGRVFFDENGDGMRQPSERPAARVTLFLDGRFPVITDGEGRFDFPLVAAGQHSIQVAIETIPLPWGLPDERSFAVSVPVRGEAIVDIALARIAPN